MDNEKKRSSNNGSSLNKYIRHNNVSGTNESQKYGPVLSNTSQRQSIENPPTVMDAQTEPPPHDDGWRSKTPN